MHKEHSVEGRRRGLRKLKKAVLDMTKGKACFFIEHDFYL
jgi:hypothetical protein